MKKFYGDEHSKENVFELDLVAEYVFQLRNYQIGHSILYLQFGKQSDHFQNFSSMSFQMVRYFDVPTFWQAKNVRTGSKDEFKAFLDEVGLYMNESDRRIMLDILRLYIFERPPLKPFRILASSGVSIREATEYKPSINDDEIIQRIYVEDGKPSLRSKSHYGGRYIYLSVEYMLVMMASGMPTEVILEGYGLEFEDIHAGLVYARLALKNKS